MPASLTSASSASKGGGIPLPPVGTTGNAGTKNGGLGTAAIIAFGGGGGLTVILLATLLTCLWRRKRQKSVSNIKVAAAEGDTENPAPGIVSFFAPLSQNDLQELADRRRSSLQASICKGMEESASQRKISLPTLGGQSAEGDRKSIVSGHSNQGQDRARSKSGVFSDVSSILQMPKKSRGSDSSDLTTVLLHEPKPTHNELSSLDSLGIDRVSSKRSMMSALDFGDEPLTMSDDLSKAKTTSSSRKEDTAKKSSPAPPPRHADSTKDAAKKGSPAPPPRRDDASQEVPQKTGPAPPSRGDTSQEVPRKASPAPPPRADASQEVPRKTGPDPSPRTDASQGVPQKTGPAPPPRADASQGVPQKSRPAPPPRSAGTGDLSEVHHEPIRKTLSDTAAKKWKVNTFGADGPSSGKQREDVNKDMKAVTPGSAGPSKQAPRQPAARTLSDGANKRMNVNASGRPGPTPPPRKDYVNVEQKLPKPSSGNGPTWAPRDTRTPSDAAARKWMSSTFGQGNPSAGQQSKANQERKAITPGRNDTTTWAPPDSGSVNVPTWTPRDMSAAPGKIDTSSWEPQKPRESVKRTVSETNTKKWTVSAAGSGEASQGMEREPGSKFRSGPPVGGFDMITGHKHQPIKKTMSDTATKKWMVSAVGLSEGSEGVQYELVKKLKKKATSNRELNREPEPEPEPMYGAWPSKLGNDRRSQPKYGIFSGGNKKAKADSASPRDARGRVQETASDEDSSWFQPDSNERSSNRLGNQGGAMSGSSMRHFSQARAADREDDYDHTFVREPVRKTKSDSSTRKWMVSAVGSGIAADALHKELSMKRGKAYF